MPGEGVQCARAGPPLAGSVPPAVPGPRDAQGAALGVASHEGHVGLSKADSAPWVGGEPNGQTGHLTGPALRGQGTGLCTLWPQNCEPRVCLSQGVAATQEVVRCPEGAYCWVPCPAGGSLKRHRGILHASEVLRAGPGPLEEKGTQIVTSGF